MSTSQGFLSPEDLAHLTGYEPGQKARMSAWLKRRGYVFVTNVRGDIVMTWAHVRVKLSEPERETTEPNYEAAFGRLRDYHAKRNAARIEREPKR